MPVSVIDHDHPDGVRPSRLQLPGDGRTWPNLLTFLVQHFPGYGEDQWRLRMTAGLVQDSQNNPLAPDAPYVAHQTIQYYRYNPDEQQIPGELDIVYRDEHLIVVDKPHFLPTIPSGQYVSQTLTAKLRVLFGAAMQDVQPIHRLDAATAGIVVCCLQRAQRGAYQRLFAERAVKKVYEAVVLSAQCVPALLQGATWQRETRIERAEQFFKSTEVSGLHNSRTRAELIAANETHSLLKLYADTGKKHQLRLHLAAAGMPICHDPLYSSFGDPAAASGNASMSEFGQPLQLLARSLSLTDPVTGHHHEFVSRRQLLLAPAR